LPLLVGAGKAASEAHDAELRRRHQLKIRLSSDQRLGFGGEVKRSVDRVPERIDTEVAE
jgi:hypothetical protein